MAGYELSVGGQKGASSATTYTDLLDLNIAINPTANGGWDATVAYDRTFEDSLMDDVWIYYDSELIFRGVLESVESSNDDSATKLSGRGVTVELRYDTITTTYTSTTAYDAIRDFWDTHTPYTAMVLPANRDNFDGVFTSTHDIRSLFNFDASTSGDKIAKDEAYVESSRLWIEHLNFTEDATLSTMATDTGASVSNSNYSQAEGIRIADNGTAPEGYVEYSYSAGYLNENYKWYVRLRSSSLADATLDYYINGTHVRTQSVTLSSLSHQWLDVLNDASLSTVNAEPSELPKSNTMRVEVSGLGSDEWVDIDAMSVTAEDHGSYTLPSSVNADGVYAGPEWYANNVLVVGGPDDPATYDSQIIPVSSTDRMMMLLETDVAVDSLTAGMENTDAGEIVDQTVTHSHPKTEHLFDFQFTNTGSEFRVRVQGNADVPTTQTSSGESAPQRFARFEIFDPDESKLVQISDRELSGTKFDIVQELHELGKYNFTVADYANKEMKSFPLGTVKSEPRWTITSENRKLDYSNYANKVTVHGKTASDGTYSSATVSDQDEITAIGQTIHIYEKNPEVETQSEVDTRAQRLLEESIAEKEESGSMDVVPMQVDAGYTYPVAPWGDAFRYGGRIGENALNLTSSGDSLDWDINGKSLGQSQTYEFLIHPRGIKDMTDDDYMGLVLWVDFSNRHELCVLRGDGSVDFGKFGADGGTARVRTEPDVIRENQTQRLSITTTQDDGSGFAQTKIYVDGELVHSESAWADVGYNDVSVYVGGGDGTGTDYYGGIDDVRVFNHSSAPLDQATIQKYAYEDLVEHPDADTGELLHYFRLDDYTASQPIDDGHYDEVNPYINLDGATYEASFGRLKEVRYSLGDEGNLSLSFDIAGRIDTELAKMRQNVQTNTKYL